MKRDLYLDHALTSARAERRAQINAGADPDLLPKASFDFLLRVVSDRFHPEKIADLASSGRLGPIHSARGSESAIQALERDPAVLAIEASRPGAGPETIVSLPYCRRDQVGRPPCPWEDGRFAIVAVIDGGIDVLHEAFRDASGRTRIRYLWDQTASELEGGSRISGMGYGPVFDEDDIDGFISRGVLPSTLDRDLDGHGTHVASIAAGRQVARFAGGVAPAADILFVRPKDSIGFARSHVDALAFIDATADSLGLPVVVNVSQGMNAGAHDGSSALEAAFDRFSNGGTKPGRIIVKSAGNEGGRGVHASLTVGQGGVETLKWVSSAPHRGPDHIEVWSDPGDEFRCRLDYPGAGLGPWLTRQEPHQVYHVDGVTVQLSCIRYAQANGETHLLLTLAADPGRRIPAGKFALEVEGVAVATAGILDAWIERAPERPIHFSEGKEAVTLSIPGTARSVISVGNVAREPPLRSGEYASSGPTRDNRRKPDICAPGEAVMAAAAGTYDGVATRSGSSQAAPHVTGAVALLLSRCVRQERDLPNAAQIAAALRGTAQNFSGHHHPRQGFGLLDVARLLQVFD